MGLSGAVMVATLARARGSSSSVSRMGFASSRGRPETILSFDAQESASPGVGITFVMQSL